MSHPRRWLRFSAKSRSVLLLPNYRQSINARPVPLSPSTSHMPRNPLQPALVTVFTGQAVFGIYDRAARRQTRGAVPRSNRPRTQSAHSKMIVLQRDCPSATLAGPQGQGGSGSASLHRRVLRAVLLSLTMAGPSSLCHRHCAWQ